MAKKQLTPHYQLPASIFILLAAFYFLLRPPPPNPQLLSLRQKISQWESIAQTKPDYRDAWLQLAKLHYELKEINLAKYYVNQALKLDPNYELAQNFIRLLPP
jgi:tetratricopeptide (TPR) repeat protein